MRRIMWFFLLMLFSAVSFRNPAPRVIMTIGDSNGASAYGWVSQLKNKLPNDTLYNYSIPGNTIGFDNLGNQKLNTLKNIDRYLSDISKKAPKIDQVVILLGTNDCKAVFAGREKEIRENMFRLIDKIRVYPFPFRSAPDILIVTPPPYGPDSLLAEKYLGGDQRVERLVPIFKQLAAQLHCGYLDIYHPLKPGFNKYAKDGVHLSAEGQKMIAALIVEALKD